MTSELIFNLQQIAVAAVAQSGKHPELRSYKEVKVNLSELDQIQVTA